MGHLPLRMATTSSSSRLPFCAQLSIACLPLACTIESWWKIWTLGALDGLAVGFLIEASRLIYERHRMTVLLEDAAKQNKPVGYLLNPALDLLIPIICLIVFSAITYLVFQYLLGRPRLLVLLWTMAGGIAVALGCFLTGSFPDSLSLLSLVVFAGLSYIIFRLWRAHPRSQPLLWQAIGVSTILALAAGVQIAGLFVVQRFELRLPLTWLLCLALVLLVNFIYGTLLRRGFSQQLGNMAHVYD